MKSLVRRFFSSPNNRPLIHINASEFGRDPRVLSSLFPSLSKTSIDLIVNYYKTLHNLEAVFKENRILEKMLEDTQKSFEQGRIFDCKKAIYIVMSVAPSLSILTNEQLARAYLLFGRVKARGNLEERATAADAYRQAFKLDHSLKVLCDQELVEIDNYPNQVHDEKLTHNQQ